MCPTLPCFPHLLSSCRGCSSKTLPPQVSLTEAPRKPHDLSEYQRSCDTSIGEGVEYLQYPQTQNISALVFARPYLLWLSKYTQANVQTIVYFFFVPYLQLNIIFTSNKYHHLYYLSEHSPFTSTSVVSYLSWRPLHVPLYYWPHLQVPFVRVSHWDNIYWSQVLKRFSCSRTGTWGLEIFGIRNRDMK